MHKASYKWVMSSPTDKQAEGQFCDPTKCPFLLQLLWAQTSPVMERPKQEWGWQSQLQVKVQVLNTPDHWCWSSRSIFMPRWESRLSGTDSSQVIPRSITGLSVLSALCASPGWGQMPHGLWMSSMPSHTLCHTKTFLLRNLQQTAKCLLEKIRP